MDDAITRYQSASAADDIDGIMATLAPDVVYGTLNGLRWTRTVGALTLFALVLGPKVGRHLGVVRRALAGAFSTL